MPTVAPAVAALPAAPSSSRAASRRRWHAATTTLTSVIGAAAVVGAICLGITAPATSPVAPPAVADPAGDQPAADPPQQLQHGADGRARNGFERRGSDGRRPDFPGGGRR